MKSSPQLFSGVQVPDPPQYLTYLFLRHPGRVLREESRAVQFLDTYEYAHARKGLAVLGDGKTLVRPPALDPLSDPPDLAGAWHLRPAWKGTISQIHMTFTLPRGGELAASLVKFQSQYFLSFPQGLESGGSLESSLLQDRWQPLGNLWFMEFLAQKTGSGFLVPRVSSPCQGGGFSRRFLPKIRDLLIQVRLYEPGILEDREPEPLHQYRVLLRKARSLVSSGAGLIPPEVAGVLKPALTELHRRTSLLRDFDVQLEEWPQASPLWAAQGGNPENFEAYLRKSRKKEVAQVKEYLSSEAHRELWGRIDAQFTFDPGDSASYSKALGALVQRLTKKVRLALEGLENDQGDEGVHRVRIALKKLRYFQEFFSLESAGDGLPSLKDLRTLQDLLGRFQDSCVRIDHLSRYREQVKTPDSRDAYAFGYLMGQLEGRKDESKARIFNLLRGNHVLGN